MENIISLTGVSDDPFALASLEHAALRGGAPALRELFADLDRLRTAGHEEGPWSRCTALTDPGPDPQPDPETPDDFEIH